MKEKSKVLPIPDDETGQDTPHILWLGPVTDERVLQTSQAVSPAANRWQFDLLSTLRKLNVRVTVLSHVPEPVWPKGRLHIARENGGLAPGLDGNVVAYWNVPYLREMSLAHVLRHAVNRSISSLEEPTVLVTYNARPSYVAVARYAQKEFGLPWVCVVADDEAPPGADGWVFLSWGYFKTWGRGPSLHLDGGVSELRFNPETERSFPIHSSRAVLYTGSMSQYAGVDYLVRAFQEVPDRNVELWLCGKGSSTVVESLASSDSRIKRFGFVPEEKLETLSLKTTAFVNPRLPNVTDNERNFPSKVLEYLSYGKPVISTWTAGLSPDYRDVLLVVDGKRRDSLASAIVDVLTSKTTDFGVLEKRIASFLSSRQWRVQAGRLLHWLEDEFFAE